MWSAMYVHHGMWVGDRPAAVLDQVAAHHADVVAETPGDELVVEGAVQRLVLRAG